MKGFGDGGAEIILHQAGVVEIVFKTERDGLYAADDPAPVFQKGIFHQYRYIGRRIGGDASADHADDALLACQEKRILLFFLLGKAGNAAEKEKANTQAPIEFFSGHCAVPVIKIEV